MIETALKYHSYGLSVVPTGKDKLPRINEATKYKWKKHQTELIKPTTEFNEAYGIAIVTGFDNLEVIDIDCKYDLTGTLFTDFKNLINKVDKEILKKLVVEKTVGGGYHFIYKCLEIEGNVKLANRHATSEELLIEPKDNGSVLIETRGIGGYFVCAPTKGYEIIYGSIDKINYISSHERQILMDCAKTFNQVFEVEAPRKEIQKIISENESPFDAYNASADVLDLLESEGWKVKLNRGSKHLLLRPAGKGAWSADYDDSKRLLYVYTSSTDFEQGKAYNPSQVLAYLRFNKDYSRTAIWLLQNGYGKSNSVFKEKPFNKPNQITETKINIDDDDYSFLATIEDTDLFINQKRNGTFNIGNSTGFPIIDKHYRFKDAQFEMVLGHDNAGKSVISWYLSVLDCYFNNEHYLIFAGENKTGAVKVKLMEFYLCKSIESMNTMEFDLAKKWVEEHYSLIRNDIGFTYKDMLVIGQKMLKKRAFKKFIIEPYNVLEKDAVNEHQYDYIAMREMRLFIRQTGIGITLNVHAATEALRKTYPKGHEYFGYTMPPNKADAEGGGKFSNKADNFLVVHRMADHPEEWMWTELHIQKIKETETGGLRTFKDSPIKIRLCAGGCGFEDAKGYNPMIQGRRKDEQLSLIPEPPKMQPNHDFDKPMPTSNMKDEPYYREPEPKLFISTETFKEEWE